MEELLARIEKLEKKIDTLILRSENAEKVLWSVEPLIKSIKKLPFIK